MKKRSADIMQKVIASCAAASVALADSPVVPSAKAETVKVHWQCTTDAQRWVDKGELETAPWDDADYGKLHIDVDQTTRYQTLTDNPWGGCFNERGWKYMQILSEDERRNIMEQLYGQEGLRLTAGRMALGNSDFSITNDQSYDELPEGVETDYDLEYFSIDNDREYMLPYIKAAMEINPDIYLWGSPWSPPSWMKYSKSVSASVPNNSIIWEPEVLRAYAQYFVKYVQAYKAEGIDISMIMPQNEPTINNGYPACLWTGDQLNEFIRDYLYPAFQEAGISTDIYLGTFTNSDATRTDPTLNDPETSKMIKGLGMQWWSAPLTKRIYKNNRETGYVLVQSETMCGGGGNDWGYVENSFDANGQFQCLKTFLEAGVNAYMLWNMVLDEVGYNTNPKAWAQNAPIIVNQKTGEVSYSPQYHLFKHFTYYIDGGARRIKTGGNYGDKIAYQTKDG